MAVKFSDFNLGATVSDIDFIVGYKSTDNVQIPIGLVTVNTTYAVATAQSGLNETLTLTGVGPASTDVITFTAGADISLTDDGAGNGFTIASTGPQGTVTSVDYTSDITALTAAGGPITTSGTLTLNNNGGVAGQYIDGAAGAWVTLPNNINTILVTVVDIGGGVNKYFIDGGQQQSLELAAGFTYRLDQSATTPSPGNSGHPLRFSTTSDGTHGGGVEYTTGVTYVGTPGTAGAYTQIIPEQDTPKLYYYCSVHPNMGGEVIDPRASGVSSVNTAVNGISSSANPLTITPTAGAVTIASNAFAGAANVGHVPTAAAAAAGAFLKQDGTWAVPPGGGGSGSVTNVDSAVTAIPGLTLVTTDQATTPTVTLGLAGTAGAGEYLDGGTGQWTALPSAAGVTMTTSPAATGNGATATYPLGVTPSNENFTMAYISGVYQLKSTYSVTGSNIIFDSNVPNGASIEIVTTT